MDTPIVEPPPSPDNLKRCTKCGEVKPRDQFRKRKSQCKACIAEREREYRRANAERIRERNHEYRQANLEHLREHDRENYHANADQIREQQRQYRQANADRIHERERKYRQANADQLRKKKREYRQTNAERIRESEREYRQANADQIRERRREKDREYRQANADQIREKLREYLQTPQGKAVQRAIRHRRRARKAGNGGNYTPADLAAVRAAQTDKEGRLICAWCGKPITTPPHLDHWVPLAKGGTNDAGNLRYLHARCNQSKGAKHPHELGRLI